MKTIFRLAKTELRILFCSPVSWLILVIFAFQAGLNFSDGFGMLLKRQALEYGVGQVTEEVYAGYTALFVSIRATPDDGIDESGVEQWFHQISVFFSDNDRTDYSREVSFYAGLWGYFDGNSFGLCDFWYVHDR